MPMNFDYTDTQAQILTAEERLLAERHRRPEAVMAETAVATGIAA